MGALTMEDQISAIPCPYLVVAGEHIHEQTFVGLDGAGRAREFVPGDTLIGLVCEDKDNSAGVADLLNIWIYPSGVCLL